MTPQKNEKKKTCGQSCMIMSRVVGFYSNVNEWNPGKKMEFKMRKSFNLQSILEDDDNYSKNMSCFTATDVI